MNNRWFFFLKSTKYLFVKKFQALSKIIFIISFLKNSYLRINSNEKLNSKIRTNAINNFEGPFEDPQYKDSKLKKVFL